MKKPFVWLLVAAVVALAALFAVMRTSLRHDAQPDGAGLKNLSVTIDDQVFAMSNGVAEKQTAPGSAARNTVRLVGEPVFGDSNGDDAPDAALLLQNDPGGSGILYYAVLAVNDHGAYRATNVLALGDRIKPQNIEFADGRFVYRFLDHGADEPMAAVPTVEKSVTVKLDPATGRISAVS